MGFSVADFSSIERVIASTKDCVYVESNGIRAFGIRTGQCNFVCRLAGVPVMVRMHDMVPKVKVGPNRFCREMLFAADEHVPLWFRLAESRCERDVAAAFPDCVNMVCHRDIHGAISGQAGGRIVAAGNRVWAEIGSNSYAWITAGDGTDWDVNAADIMRNIPQSIGLEWFDSNGWTQVTTETHPMLAIEQLMRRERSQSVDVILGVIDEGMAMGVVDYASRQHAIMLMNASRVM